MLWLAVTSGIFCHETSASSAALLAGRGTTGRHLRQAPEAVRHERDILNAGRKKLDFSEIDQCKLVLLGLSLAGNLVNPLLSLYGTEWRERGYGLSLQQSLYLAICRPFEEPRNRFPTWQAGMKTLFAESISRNRFPGSLNVYKYGLRSP
jgi:hypothetical protein